MTAYAAPPFDPELALALPGVNATVPSTITLEMALAGRSRSPQPDVAALAPLLAKYDVSHADHVVAGRDGGEITVAVFKPANRTKTGALIHHSHGGGMIGGDRFTGVASYLQYVDSHQVTIVSTEYRLAPQYPDPFPIEDSYAALNWAVDQSSLLGFDPTRVIIAGSSAGGGIAAGLVLLSRDRRGPSIYAQLLRCPMLDDRGITTSSQQYEGVGVWDRTSNETGWSALLGARRATEDVSIYAAPARAEDLSGLPQTYIDAGSAEVFRDEVVAYATGIWAAGGIADLHIWAGGFHGYDTLAPDTWVARRATDTRHEWLTRVLED